ncbi:MAG: DapH/DapD/GlmU-related protein [Thermaerobacter sp.]|nr:DapH/DapD/GlmU-related protein [Thermaerobacter sp.]
MAMVDHLANVGKDVILGDHVYIGPFANLYGCKIGSNTKIGAFVEIQAGVKIGKRCKISSHSFVCRGVTIEDEVFVGHGVMFTNDKYPKAVNSSGCLMVDGEWAMQLTLVRAGSSIGSGAVIMCGVVIGANAVIGAGAVVLHDVKDNEVVVGVPARALHSRKRAGK